MAKSKAKQPPKRSKRVARSKKVGHHHDPLEFPKGFLWGAATSAHQVEGNNIHNDWWAWEQRKGSIETGEVSGRATDHYNRYEEDFELAQKLHHNAHRLSVEWSRIEPEEGQWDWDEVEHYRDVLQSLKERGMSPAVTLHHFTSPQWIALKGGWANDETPLLFARYAEFLAEHLGEYVDHWITINEPMIYITQCYRQAVWPPQDKNRWRMVKAFRNMVRGHKMAYREIHAELGKQKREASVGIAKNVISMESYHDSFADYLFIRFSEYVWNHLFFSKTRRYHDFIGVNYYLHQRVRRDGNTRFHLVDVRKDEQRETSSLGWEVYAPGFFDALMDMSRYKKPIFITENGIAADNDDKRSRFIVSHLKEMYHAIKAGVDVRGYFHWSLLDNFEWDKGFTPRFGLVDVNYNTFKRTPRPSAYVYANICKDNAISHDLLRFIGHGVHKEKRS
ncbi:MAG: glycoside hydrolase family 1 protein [Candidatus Kerfeldbacteria bacterium]